MIYKEHSALFKLAVFTHSLPCDYCKNMICVLFEKRYIFANTNTISATS
jgi:hypothetical protein